MGGVVGLLGVVVGFCVVLDGLCVLSVLEGSGGAEKSEEKKHVKLGKPM